MSEHQKIFSFSFELEHIPYIKNTKIVKSKDVLFDNNTRDRIELFQSFDFPTITSNINSYWSKYDPYSYLGVKTIGV